MLFRQTPGQRQKKQMRQMAKQLAPKTTALTLFLQSAGSFALGLLMLLNGSFFLASVTQIIFLYFIFVLASNLLRMLTSFRQGAQKALQRLLVFLASIAITRFLWRNLQDLYTVIPIALSLWLMILSISSFISFVQYRGEKNTAFFRYFVAAIGNVGFAMLFVVNADNRVSASLHILGVYSILIGASFFSDFLALALPNSFLNRVKRHLRIAPPLFLTVLLPQQLVNDINASLAQSEDVPDVFKVENATKRPEDIVNVELFVHISKRPGGAVGHIDIAVGDTVYCYGAYDKQQSKKYGGIAGAGVLYEVCGKAAYITFCKTLADETLFGFGLALQPEELAKMKAKIAEMKARSYPWLCPAQRAMAEGKPADAKRYADIPSRLANAVQVTFYKFNRGTYKHYWLLGTNCVTFVDDLLRASGMKTVMAGIITPGAYFAFLNGEFRKGGSVVIKREVYHKVVDHKR